MSQVVNIGQNQRLTRKVMGLATLLGGFIIGVLITNSQTNPALHLITFILAFLGFITYLEGYYGVCPMNAMRGKQSMEGYFSIGQEDVEDESQIRAAKQVVMQEVWQAVILAVLVTIPFILFTIA